MSSTAIELKNPDLAEADEICLCGLPLLHLEEDHDKVAQLKGQIDYRCSVCDLVWPDWDTTHIRHALMFEGDGRKYADRLIYVGDQRVHYEELP